MKSIKLKLLLITTLFLVLTSGSSSSGLDSISKDDGTTTLELNNLVLNEDLVFEVSENAELTSRIRTRKFVDSTRALPENNATSLNSIFYRVKSLSILDPALGNLSTGVKSFWVNQVLSFRSTNGGFGGWLNDRSSISSTYKALEVLNLLNYDLNQVSFNKTHTAVYLERLRNSLTLGYNSHLADGDSDITSTSYAVKSYAILALPIPNESNVTDLFQRAQNLDGGFGEQTNNQKAIYWTSRVSTTFNALTALNLLSKEADDQTAAISFVQSVQTGPLTSGQGGYINTAISTVTSVAHTANALVTLEIVGEAALNDTAAKEYILSLENIDGSFDLETTSLSSSLKATYFAILGLNSINSSRPANILNSISFLVNYSLNTDGYGGTPGEEATLRETFDAVASYKYMGLVSPNSAGIMNSVASYRNLDGGYGVSGSFIDSTNRAVNIYDLLNLPYPNPSETISFVKGMQLAGGGFTKKDGTATPYVVSTYRAVLTLSILNDQPSNVPNTITYLKSTQNPDGGFGGFVGDTSDVSSTYRAVKALSILGDNTFNVQGAIDFLRGSQNIDGGFKRSVSDVIRPNNNSHAVYTYSSVRALEILNSEAINSTALYNYIVSLRNTDGGYAEHAAFTSDNAYTFTSLWLLSNYDEFTGFETSIQGDISSVRTDYDSFNFTIHGSSSQYNYTLKFANSSEIIVEGLLDAEGTINVDTSAFNVSTYELNLYVFDLSGAVINGSFPLLIGDVTLTTGTTSSTIATSETTTETTPPTSEEDQNDILDNIVIIGVATGGIVVVAIIVQSRKSK